MKEFTPTEFRANSSKVFNQVQESGKIKIVSKSRPDMILMTEKVYLRLSESKKDHTWTGNFTDAI